MVSSTNITTSENYKLERATAIQENSAPKSPLIHRKASCKGIYFSWNSSNNVTNYKVYQNVDGASGFTQIGSDIDGKTNSFFLNIAAHQLNWVNAQYFVEACNSTGCSSSDTFSVTEHMLDTIRKIQGSAQEGDYFGLSVRLSGDGSTLAVGASHDDSFKNSGAVYIYTLSESGWTEQAYIKVSNAGEGDFFGQGLDLSYNGNTIAVGAPFEDGSSFGDQNNPSDDDNQKDSGAVYIFTREGKTWKQEAYIKAENSAESNLFGFDIEISDDGLTLEVSARGEDSFIHGVNETRNTDKKVYGAAYIFKKDDHGWTQEAFIKPSTGRGGSFGEGFALTSQGNILAVSSGFEEAAYVYEKV